MIHARNYCQKLSKDDDGHHKVTICVKSNKLVSHIEMALLTLKGMMRSE